MIIVIFISGLAGSTLLAACALYIHEVYARHAEERAAAARWHQFADAPLPTFATTNYAGRLIGAAPTVSTVAPTAPPTASR